MLYDKTNGGHVPHFSFTFFFSNPPEIFSKATSTSHTLFFFIQHLFLSGSKKKEVFFSKKNSVYKREKLSAKF